MVSNLIRFANIFQVQNFLVHFWQGMPSHMLEVLGSNEVVELIGQCDVILYKAISGVLIPGTLQPLPARYAIQLLMRVGHNAETENSFFSYLENDRQLL